MTCWHTFVSTAAAARILRVSRKQVLRLIESGKLTGRVVGRSGDWQITYESVFDYRREQLKKEEKGK